MSSSMRTISIGEKVKLLLDKMQLAKWIIDDSKKSHTVPVFRLTVDIDENDHFILHYMIFSGLNELQRNDKLHAFGAEWHKEQTGKIVLYNIASMSNDMTRSQLINALSRSITDYVKRFSDNWKKDDRFLCGSKILGYRNDMMSSLSPKFLHLIAQKYKIQVETNYCIIFGEKENIKQFIASVTQELTLPQGKQEKIYLPFFQTNQTEAAKSDLAPCPSGILNINSSSATSPAIT